MIPAAFKSYVTLAKGAAVLVLLLVVYLTGDHNGDTRRDREWSARWHQHVAEDATQWAAQEAAHRKQQEEDAALIALLEAQGYAALQENHREIEKLRAAVAAGAVRVRVKARCPSVPATPGAPQDPGLGDGAAAELDPAARQDYLDLRAGIGHQFQQLTTCQVMLKGLTAPSSH